jgi:hypothetical protein
VLVADNGSQLIRAPAFHTTIAWFVTDVIQRYVAATRGCILALQ